MRAFGLPNIYGHFWKDGQRNMEDAIEKLALETVETVQESGKNESFEVIDYVRELFLNSEEQKKLEQKMKRAPGGTVKLWKRSKI